MNRLFTGFFNFLDLIKFHHTVFALPFAVLSMFYAAEGVPQMQKFVWVIIAMAGARSSAMAFNRIIDLKFDKINPRTMSRPLVTGRITMQSAVVFMLFSIALFIFSAYKLNLLCLYLSPVALVVILGYSWTKRFTPLSHFVLGLALAIAPVGAWIAVTGGFALFPLMISMFVMLWTAGFDVIYSTLDVEFDKRAGLFSIPALFGVKGALRLSAVLHFLALVSLFAMIPLFKLGWLFTSGCIVTAAILVVEHKMVRPNDLKRVNNAFFNANALISMSVMIFALLELFFAR